MKRLLTAFVTLALAGCATVPKTPLTPEMWVTTADEAQP